MYKEYKFRYMQKLHMFIWRRGREMAENAAPWRIKSLGRSMLSDIFLVNVLDSRVDLSGEEGGRKGHSAGQKISVPALHLLAFGVLFPLRQLTP